MLHAECLNRVLCRLCPASFRVLVAFANRFNSFKVVLLFLFEIGCKYIVERRRGVLPVPSSIVLQLRFSFRLERDHVHGVQS
jgi:hypothetical protein